MARRIDIELTSAREDGTWTWRAAGAREPKGVLEGAVLYQGAKVGDVVRAEAEFEIDGIVVTSVIPPKEKKADTNRLEIIGPQREFRGVTSSLVGRERRAGGPRRERDGERRPRREREGREGRPPREGGPRGERAGRPPRERTERAERRTREGAERPAPPARPKPKRLVAGNTHRTAVLDSLSPEQRPIAEQVLRGGIPAVRQAVEQQNAQARAEGRPEIRAEPLVAIAEELLPRLKAAEWRDRAEAAVRDVDELALRDLRSVVAGADSSARDDDTRLLAKTLREALDRRLAAMRDEWLKEITGALDEGRLVRALRLSARPPDPTIRFPADLAVRLSEAAGGAMTPDIAPDRWLTLLDAVAASPVRRSVKPAGLPAEPGAELQQRAAQLSGTIPALAAMLGIELPPPPAPVKAARRPAKAPAKKVAARPQEHQSSATPPAGEVHAGARTEAPTQAPAVELEPGDQQAAGPASLTDQSAPEAQGAPAATAGSADRPETGDAPTGAHHSV